MSIKNCLSQTSHGLISCSRKHEFSFTRVSRKHELFEFSNSCLTFCRYKLNVNVSSRQKMLVEIFTKILEIKYWQSNNVEYEVEVTILALNIVHN